MENIIIDLKLKVTELEKENIALKAKMTLMYSNWSYDYNRFTELKTKCQFGYCKTKDDINDDESIRRAISTDSLRMV